jgi:hypothetical protein
MARSIVMSLRIKPWRNIDHVRHGLFPHVLYGTRHILNTILNELCLGWRGLYHI